MSYKEEFLEIFNEKVERPGASELLDWLENKTDFFTAPASTKYHCACNEGLVMHSLSVYKVMVERYLEEGDNPESFAICALLHDLCKTGFYKISTRNIKNEETGKWEKVPYYAIEDKFPFGHGEKSVFLIERFMRLKPDEAIAIRWHMGEFDGPNGFCVSQAYEKYPLAVKLHLADLESTYLKERNTSAVNN